MLIERAINNMSDESFEITNFHLEKEGDMYEAQEEVVVDAMGAEVTGYLELTKKIDIGVSGSMD